MTQGHGGQRSPVTTEFDSAGNRTGASTGAGSANGAPHDAPSPSNSTASTPWGSTSTASGSGYGAPAGSANPGWPSNQGYADSATGGVPLVQGTAAGRTMGGTATAGAPAGSAAAGTAAGSAGRSAASSAGRAARGPRRARLQLRHINPWTVLKFSCVLSIALFFVWLIVVGVLFGVLDAAGVIGKINDAYTTIQGGKSSSPVTAGIVFGSAAIVGIVNIVLFIALTTVGSVVYNLCADLVGGIEITLSER